MNDDRPEWEWVTPGAAVATLSSGRILGVKRAVIARVGKRDVVLDDGQRFSLRTLSRTDGGTWGLTTVLLPGDDPRVMRAEEAAARARLLGRAKAACDDFRAGKITAFDAILALAPLTGVADEIRALDVSP